MIYNKEEILSICKDILGDDCDGIFIHYNRLNGGDDLPFAINESCDRFIETGDTIMGFVSHAGVSKLVFVPDEGDYVIKIPVTGVYCEIGNDGSDDDYEHDFEEDEFEVIARATEDTNDIFEDEENIYQNANEMAKEILLPNILVGYLNGIPIYVQQKLSEIYGYSSKSTKCLSKDERTRTERIFRYSNETGNPDRDYYYACSTIFINDIIEYYGEDKAVEICKLLRKLDDLHDCNYGYVNGVPKIHDFGGFESDDTYWSWF